MNPISSYRLVTKLGQGGMAEVYKAIKSGPDGFSKTVALKKILPFHADQEQFVRMLTTEAKIHSHLNHPNIVQILDFFEEAGQYSIVLEYVDGKNLKELLNICKQRNQPIPWQACTYIVLEVLKGLTYAHTKNGPEGPLNIIHRDVSPHNILISYQGEIKLSDFGIARAQIERDETESGVLKGKDRYVSPEQILNEPLTPASDLFSIGTSFYEMLSLKHPFGEKQEYQTLQNTIHKKHEPLNSIVSNLNPEISHLLDRVLEKKPHDRYQNAKEFYEDLLELQDPSWFTHGQELLTTFLSNILPLHERIEEPLEKTSILTPSSPNESMPSENIEKVQPQTINMVIVLPFLITAVLAIILFKSILTPLEKKTPPEQTLSSNTQSMNPEEKKSPNTTQNFSHLAITPISNSGHIEISGPQGADVYINGKLMGNLPLPMISLPPGVYMILLDDHHDKQLSKVNVVPKETLKHSWK